jgi:hypothetical protein
VLVGGLSLRISRSIRGDQCLFSIGVWNGLSVTRERWILIELGVVSNTVSLEIV